MNALTLVIEQHREIEALSRALLVSAPDMRAHVLSLLADRLEAHLEIDEKILYPSVRSHRNAKAIEAYLDHHHDLRMLVVRLTSQGFVHDPLFIDQVALFGTMFRAHAHDEEKAHLLPVLAMSFSESELEALGAEMVRPTVEVRTRARC